MLGTTTLATRAIDENYLDNQVVSIIKYGVPGTPVSPEPRTGTPEPSRIVMGQGPHGVQMVRQNDKGIDVERVAFFNLGHNPA
jgi:hypothetical protein